MSDELEMIVRQQSEEIARLRDAVESLRLRVDEIGNSALGADGLVGDCDLTPDSGYIEIDRTVPTHPVARLRADRLPRGGDGEKTPGNFDPEFEVDTQDDDKVKLSSIGSGYCPFGRAFYYVNVGSQADSSAKIETGVIYLEVQHPGPSGSDPTITVKGASNPSFSNTDTTKTLIPLYSINKGEIVADYRCCMSLPIREL